MNQLIIYITHINMSVYILHNNSLYINDFYFLTSIINTTTSPAIGQIVINVYQAIMVFLYEKKRACGPLGYISLTHSHTGGWKWLASRVAISS